MLNAEAQLFGKIKIFRGHSINAFHNGSIGVQRYTKGNGCQYHQLMRSIGSINIEGWISFCVSQRLRFCQYIIKAAACIGHFGQNEVACAVDNACHTTDNISRQRFAKHFNHRYSTGNSGFKSQSDLGLLCQGDEFISKFSNKRFVSCNHMLTRLNRLGN